MTDIVIGNVQPYKEKIAELELRIKQLEDQLSNKGWEIENLRIEAEANRDNWWV